MSGPCRALWELLFPEKCVCCRHVTGGGPLCEGCAAKLRRLPSVERHPRHTAGVDRMAAVYAYAGAGGALVRAFKFRGRGSAYEALRPGFEETVTVFYAGEHMDVIVPVPMYRAAQAKRGFNQAERIARSLAKQMGAPFEPNALEKGKRSRVQHTLPAGERAENVKGVYRATGDLTGKTVLLVDDIVTTGATLCACAAALKGAGAVRVLCAAVLAAE